ncbi:Hexuronate transporter [Halioglobus japonicus]|nr:Hexuronate transporter [Halioglobus japonicus]
MDVKTGSRDAGVSSKSQPFYGWRIVGLTTLAQLFAVGCTSYIFGIYVEPIAAEFDASRFVVTSGMAAILLSMTLIAPLLGHWLDKHSIRNTMAMGALLMGLGFACLSQATAIWQMGFVLISAIAVGAAMLGPLPSSKLVTNWFSARRGRALGISTLGTSLGGFILPPVVAWLIISIGWRGSFICLSLFILFVVLPLVFFTVFDKPRDKGLLVDGGAVGDLPQAVEDAAAQDVSISAILANPSFWGIGLCVGCLSSAGAILLTHFASYALEFDITLTGAAMVISFYSMMAMVGKLGFGYLADIYDKRVLLRIAITWNSLWWITFLNPHSLHVMIAGGAILGLGTGATMPLWNALVASCFGRMMFARAMGYMGLLVLPLTLIPMPLGGFIFDHTGSYFLVFQLALLLFPLAFIATFLIQIPQREPSG